MPREDGILLFDKPAGISSAEALNRLKNEFPGQALGHGGTLDPFATGLLTVLVGRATRLADYFLHSAKTYSGTIRFGFETDSGDRTGARTREAAIPEWTPGRLQAGAQRFVGQTYWQTPPMYSAKKQNGRALYELARQGLTVERKPVGCEIWDFEIKARPADATRADFKVSCSSGTYVRTLSEDLAKGLETVAHLEELRREKVGTLTLNLDPAQNWIPFDRALDHWPAERRKMISEADLPIFKNGKMAELQRLAEQHSWDRALIHAIYHPAGELISITAWSENLARWEFARVFATKPAHAEYQK